MTVITTSSTVAVQGALLTVQRKVYAPVVVIPVMVVVRKLAFVMFAVTGPPVWVQEPLPMLGLVAAMVAEPLLAQMVWSFPAFDALGGAFTWIVTSSVDAVHGLLLMVHRRV